MVQVTYPGVYIQEVPSGVRTITPVATSIGAFIGYFRQGPMDKAVEINGMTDYDRVFGGLDSDSEASYAIAQFFLNGGSKAYVVRVAGGTGADAAVIASVKLKTHPKQGVSQAELMEVKAANQGKWGNALRVIVEPNADQTSTSPGTFNLTVTRFASTKTDARAIVSEPPYLNLSLDSNSPRYFVDVINEESSLITVKHPKPSSTTPPISDRLPAANGTLGKPVGLTGSQIAALNAETFKVDVRIQKSAGPTSVSGVHTATLQIDTSDPSSLDRRRLRAALENAIRTATPSTGSAHPSLAGATVDLVHDPNSTNYQFLIRSAPRASSYSPLEWIDISTDGTSTADDDLGFKGAGISENVQEYVLGTTDPMGTGVSQVNGDEGKDGKLPGATALKGSQAAKSGMYALEDVDLFNILMIPRAADLSDTEMTAVISESISYCEDRRAFMIIDIPKTVDSVQDAKDWIDSNGGFRHKSTATYFPRLLLPDPKNEYRLRSVGAGGTMAGVYAKTDSTRGVWKAPAGLDARLRGVSRLDYLLTDPENGSLNPIAINCMRTFPIPGSVAWGARTLDGSDAAASEWKYIPVRRLALMLEESLFRGTKWVVFEPNDEPTWAKVRQNIRAFMMSLFRQGAFQGDSPDKAFYVKCDGETTTADDRNRGIVNIEVGFAPLKPAEFVVIKIQQIPDVE